MAQDEWVNITLFVRVKFAHFQTSVCLQCGESSSDTTSRAGGSEDNYLRHVQYLPLTNFKMFFRVNKIPVTYASSHIVPVTSETMFNNVKCNLSFCVRRRNVLSQLKTEKDSSLTSSYFFSHYCRRVVSGETSARRGDIKHNETTTSDINDVKDQKKKIK